MSFREMRNLVEHLRSLGFPRLVSLENFTAPNFQLVNEVLAWLSSCVDGSHASLPSSIDTEQQRVTLINTAAVFFYQTLGIQLNTKKLYGADRLAARELLKITTVVYQAIQSMPTTEGDEMHPSPSHHPYPQVSVKELQETRQLASSVIHRAANLCDSLQHEVENKVERTSAVKQAIDLDKAESCITSSLHSVAALVAQMTEDTEHLSLKQKELDERIQQKKESLVRRHKRLDVLKKMRPAWQHDFQREEEELKDVWQEYVTKHIYLSYLENQLQPSPPSSPSQERETGGPHFSGSVRGAVGRAGMFTLGVAKHSFEEASTDEDEYLDQSSSEEDNTLSFS
ncbi:clusterin-associated protein 1 homolog [Eriocheir sinensis]|uniref:clusterin-associated protein 1 homolog n=1 Tax=Eriocheir sinensis TaxID=95602 RepID=UPI0021C9E290|nr:clusterin-associated protein 1 homolog [Eriocheir sinensis]